MAIATFTWAPDEEPNSESTFKTRKSQFGDGYVQVLTDGLNSEQQSWDLTFGGLSDEIAPILAFVRAHGGGRSFLWTTPEGVLGMYRCESIQQQRKAGGIVVLTATFERAYHP